MKVLFSAVVLAVLSGSVSASESTTAVSVKPANLFIQARITSYNVCYTKLLRYRWCCSCACNR